MQRFIFSLLLLFPALQAFAQSSTLRGTLKEENGAAIGYAPVVLLNPADSTMAYYSVTNDKGNFEIKNIRNGKYLLQATSIGHETIYRNVIIPSEEGNNTGLILMKSVPVALKEVVIAGEHIPLQFRHDTVEYNTAAYKTKPDAVVEDLLKKLPGIEVDRAGNIKAMGEDVKKVLVDGREFFGSDQKLATRNVPADALKKVQVFDKKSDESEFTGIDDGTRDKTLNLLLKENRKNAIFGELLGAAGNAGYYQGSGKAYKFTDKNQIAVLGMMNNINQFGFSFKDYIDFNGGLQSLGGNGGGVQIKLSDNDGSSFPVNFGQPVDGLATAGAAGFNFSRVFKKDSRIFMSYIANGSDRSLLQNTSTYNFTNSDSYRQQDSLKQNKNDRVQSINFGLRDRIDSTQNIIINGSASLSSGRTISNTSSLLFNYDSDQNRLSAYRSDHAIRFGGNISGSYTKLINRGKTVFRLGSDASWSHETANSSWLTDTYFFNPGNSIVSSQFQDNLAGLAAFSLNSSLTIKTGTNLYLEPVISAGRQIETLSRHQGVPSDAIIGIDSLSPDFSRSYDWLKPGIRLLHNTERVQSSLGMKWELGKTANSLNREGLVNENHIYFTPDFSWEYEYKTGRRLRAYFQTMVNVPDVNQLLPVIDYSNPLALNRGNRNLKPEVGYDLSVNWWIFDQFSFTSLLTDVTATYTKDKINWNRTIDENLRQFMSLINVADDYRLRAAVSFSTPVRSIGIKVNANLEENWNRGLNFINGIKNTNTNFSHKISLSIENRKKTKFDVTAGSSVQITDAKFSVQNSLNDRYIDFSYFTDLLYNPCRRWNFQFTSEITNYNSRSFGKAVVVPLMGTEMSYYFLKNYRGTLSLQASDILNRNRGIVRTSEFNYLREQRSNMLSRFVILSFKYRLNKFGNDKGGLDIKIKNH